MAEQLLREGAQDYLLRGEIDCAPLARALRNAVDRHRLAAAIRSVAMVDTLTGLLSHNAFLLLAQRDLRLAQRSGQPATILVAEPAPSEQTGRDLDRDMRLVKAAERLRTLAGDEDLMGRIGDDRLAMVLRANGMDGDWAGRSTPETRRHLRLGAECFDPSAPEEIQRLLDRAVSNLEPAVAAAP
jgi:GGDEF domain-containing protein